jgi:hypothetical protein
MLRGSCAMKITMPEEQNLKERSEHNHCRAVSISTAPVMMTVSKRTNYKKLFGLTFKNLTIKYIKHL